MSDNCWSLSASTVSLRSPRLASRKCPSYEKSPAALRVHRRLWLGDHPRPSVRARRGAPAPSAPLGLRLQLRLHPVDPLRPLAVGAPQLVLLRARPGELAVQEAEAVR